MCSVTKLNTILDYMKKKTRGENKPIYSIEIFKMFFGECYYTNDITFDSARKITLHPFKV